MITSVDGKIDFLTVTTNCSKETQKLSALALKIAASLPASKPWRMLRYSGWIAKSPAGVGGVAIGYLSNASGVMQVWGELSNRWLFEAMKGMLAKVTRCDYAVTVLFDCKQPPIRDMLDGLEESQGQFTAVVPVSGQGGTLYVGSRASEKFGRIYDKGAQLGADMPDRVYWRYEVEYKRSCAQNAVHVIANAGSQTDRLKAIIGNVWQFFLQAGVPMPTLAIDVYGYPVVKYAIVARSFDKTLQWLETQVNPALVRLYQEGFWKDALKALGVEGTDCVTVQLNTEAEEYVNLQDDFLDSMQGHRVDFSAV